MNYHYFVKNAWKLSEVFACFLKNVKWSNENMKLVWDIGLEVSIKCAYFACKPFA
jgi:hypothetical protein